MKKIEVVGAAILENGEVLTMQRSQQMSLPGLWEFPGGKIETGETDETALIREIKEELNVDIQILDYVEEGVYTYSFGQVTLRVYTAEIISGELVLKEHSDQKWLDRSTLDSVEWAPVDIPAVEKLKTMLR